MLRHVRNSHFIVLNMINVLHTSHLYLLFTSLLLISLTVPQTRGAVEGGALLKGNVLSSASSVIPEASVSSLAIKWSNIDIDPGSFCFILIKFITFFR